MKRVTLTPTQVRRLVDLMLIAAQCAEDDDEGGRNPWSPEDRRALVRRTRAAALSLVRRVEGASK